MIKITDVAFTGYPVTDLAVSRHFYEDILGLTGQVYSEEGNCAWVEYELPSGTFAISNIAPDWIPSTDGPSIGLELEDLNAAVEELKKQGVPVITEPFETPICFLAQILDPDKNSIMLHQRKACHPEYKH